MFCRARFYVGTLIILGDNQADSKNAAVIQVRLACHWGFTRLF